MSPKKAGNKFYLVITRRKGEYPMHRNCITYDYKRQAISYITHDRPVEKEVVKVFELDPGRCQLTELELIVKGFDLDLAPVDIPKNEDLPHSSHYSGGA